MMQSWQNEALRTAPSAWWSAYTDKALVNVHTATEAAAAIQKPVYFLNAAVMTTPPVRYSGTAAIQGIKYSRPCDVEMANRGRQNHAHSRF